MYGKRSMETYITICKMNSQQEFAAWLRKRSGMRREVGRRFKREGIYVYLWLIHVEI